MCSLVVQWLGLGVFAARGPISISEQGIKILQTSQCSQKKKKGTYLQLKTEKKNCLPEIFIELSDVCFIWQHFFGVTESKCSVHLDLCPLAFGGHLGFQFSSVAQLCLTLCDPMNRSMPGLPVHHQLPESTQTHVHQVSDAIQPSHPLSSPSPPALNLSQHQGLFK